MHQLLIQDLCKIFLHVHMPQTKDKQTQTLAKHHDQHCTSLPDQVLYQYKIRIFY